MANQKRRKVSMLLIIVMILSIIGTVPKNMQAAEKGIREREEEPALNATANLAHLTFTKCTEGGQSSQNQSTYNYQYYWGRVVKSYLEQNTDGSFQRIEACGDGVYIETYSEDFILIDSRKIEMALPLFGGYFSGSQYNFLVFGRENPEESDDVEVLRVVKYDKNWKNILKKLTQRRKTGHPKKMGHP